MQQTLKKGRVWFAEHSLLGSCLLIFGACVFVYMMNSETRTSNDNIPTTLIALNWLINHRFDLDAFRDGHFYQMGELPYFFGEAPNGHLTATYPIGTAIITFPLYCLFFGGLKIVSWVQGNPAVLDIVSADFNPTRLLFSKIAATLITSLTVVLFYVMVRLKFNQAIAILSSFIYAFATSAWVINSQGLWQHTGANLALVMIMLALLKANRLEGPPRRILLLGAGIFCGLMPGIRPTSTLFSIAAVIYAIVAYRKDAIFLLLGLPSALINASWNFYFFGFSLKNFIIGGYSNFSDDFTESFYVFTWEQFKEGFLGLLVSPNRGLFVFTPVSLFAFPGLLQVFRFRAGRDEKLMACMAIAAAAVFGQYCFFTVWTGGNGFFSPRYLCDILPVVCFLIAYFIADMAEQLTRLNQRRRWRLLVPLIFALSILFSTGVQIVGIFGDTPWGRIPLTFTLAPERIWDWQDSHIQRSANTLRYKLLPPITNPSQYLAGIDGTMASMTDLDGQPLTSPIQMARRKWISLKTTVTNTGTSPWYGYQSGINKGEIRIRARFFNPANEHVSTGNWGGLYISGNPKPGESSEAIGYLRVPQKPGNYRLEFDWTVQGMGKLPNLSQAPLVYQVIRPN